MGGQDAAADPFHQCKKNNDQASQDVFISEGEVRDPGYERGDCKIVGYDIEHRYKRETYSRGDRLGVDPEHCPGHEHNEHHRKEHFPDVEVGIAVGLCFIEEHRTL